jgi:hypothetical protein
MLTKLATFRGVSDAGEPLVRLFRQGDSIQKVAGSMMPEIQEFLGAYKSDKENIAVLLNAMGGSEYWGQNVNGDVFPWSALLHDCRLPNHQEHPYDDFIKDDKGNSRRVPQYGYWTFLNALPFVHHKNKDANRAFGKVLVACINKKMKRVELVALLARKLAAKFDAQHVIDKIDAGEFPDVSMGCRVPYDVCTICGHKSRTKEDYCDCIRLIGMNKILDDGRRIGVINYYPRFFDISFVFIGADRTAKVMMKLGSQSDETDLWLPQSVRDGERIYGVSEEKELVKAASMVTVPDFISNIIHPKTPAETMIRLLDGKKSSRTVAQASLDALKKINDERAAHKTRIEFRDNERTAYGDGTLRTNAAEMVDSDLGNKYAAKDEISKTFTVTGNSEAVEKIEAVLSAAKTLGNWGASRTLKLGIDGDGQDHLDVKGVRPVDRKHFDKLTERDEIWSSAIKLAHELHKEAATPLSSRMERLYKRRPDILNRMIGPPPSSNRKEFPFVGSMNFHGLKINIENKAGDVREGVSKSGKKWQTEMIYPYGEIEGFLGADKDHIDVYVGPNKDAKNVHVVHQNFVDGPKKGTYDEDKVMLGFDSAEEAKQAYLLHYNRPDFFRSVSSMSLDMFKKILKSREVEGEKVAGELEDYFTNAKGSIRRERVWKDEVTGKCSYHVGSGLGSSFDTMQKTAEENDVLSKIFETTGGERMTGHELAEKYAARIKAAAMKAAQEEKAAEIDKVIEPTQSTGRIIQALRASEPTIPPALLDEAAHGDLRCALATPSMMGIVLKPEEFQRLLLSHIGKGDVADELDEKNIIFPESKESLAPCGHLTPDFFSEALMNLFSPMMGERSYLGPTVNRRVIRLKVTAVPASKSKSKESPLLTKMGAAYNWYRQEMLKAAAHASEVVAKHPALLTGVFGVSDIDLFSKTAADSQTVTAVLGSIPLALMYSASAQRDLGKGEDVGLIKRVIAEHPNLSAIGVAALVREAMKDEQVHRVVTNILRELAIAGHRVWAGGA